MGLTINRILKIFIIFLRALFCAEASVIIIPAGNALPKAYPGTGGSSTASISLETFFRESAPRAFNENQEALISSYGAGNTVDNLKPSSDSFVRGAIEAWGLHQHLVVRPEEIWFTILVQMSFYMSNTKNAEALRQVFVSHQGQQVISIMDLNTTRALSQFRFAIQARTKVPWLMDWIVPNHTTTVTEDIMVSNVLMMGLMKAYFSYSIPSPVCGLPSVTLLGVRADYEKIREKVQKLTKFGEEPAEYQNQLLPILNRLIRSFDEPSSSSIREFWNSIVHTNVIPGKRAGCSVSPTQWEISGWITGFQYWDEGGHVLGGRGTTTYSLDDVHFPIRDQKRIPVGYSMVPVALRPIGQPEINSTVVAGTIGKKISPGPPAGYLEAIKKLNSTLLASLQSSPANIHNQLQPTSAWLMYAAKRNTGEGEFARGGDPERDKMQQFMRCPNNFTEFAWGIHQAIH